MGIIGVWSLTPLHIPPQQELENSMTLATWDQIISEIDYSDLHCDNCRGSLKRYMEKQVETGGALRAVLENDLFGAYSRLDPDHRDALYSTVKWIFNQLPQVAYGSKERVTNWLLSGRDIGWMDDNE